MSSPPLFFVYIILFFVLNDGCIPIFSDTFEEDITKGYIMDPCFRKVIAKMGTHSSFKTKNKIIYTKNRGGENVVCVPSAMLAETTLKTRVLDQVHQVVGHYSPQRTSDYQMMVLVAIHIHGHRKFLQVMQNMHTSKR